MKRLVLSLVVGLAVASFLVAGCSQAAPASPTQAPAASSKAAEPTKAPAAPAQPTAAPAPAKQVNYPVKGKAIMLIVPFDAGGATDIQARVLAPILEKELGTSVEVVNKPGAGSQIGLTELASAKPDGYTLGFAMNPTAATIYLDPERKASFNRKSFVTVAQHSADPQVIAVKGDGPYKSVKDLVEAAKAKPGQVKATCGAVMGDNQLAVMLWEKQAGVKFPVVNITTGGAALIATVMGGHTDFVVNSVGNFAAQVKSGELRVIGVMDKERSPFLPDVPTMAEQGYNVQMVSSKGVNAPAGTPQGIVDVLSGAIKKAMDNDEHKKKMAEMFLTQRYLDSKQYAAAWDEMEAAVKPLLEEARKK